MSIHRDSRIRLVREGLPVPRWFIFLCPHRECGGRLPSETTFIRALIPRDMISKGPTLNRITLVIWGEAPNIQMVR